MNTSGYNVNFSTVPATFITDMNTIENILLCILQHLSLNLKLFIIKLIEDYHYCRSEHFIGGTVMQFFHIWKLYYSFFLSLTIVREANPLI